MPPPCTSSLKRSREEEDEDNVASQKRSGRSRMHRYMEKTSVPASPKETVVVHKARSLPSSPLGPLFKLSSVDGNLVEDPRNFPQATGVITCVRDTGYLKIWHHLQGCIHQHSRVRNVFTKTQKIIEILFREGPGITPSLII